MRAAKGNGSMDMEYFKRTFNFSSDSATPLYEQLASYIKYHIQAGVFKPGDRMITENELCDILGVSRTTVRLSMNKLVDEGLIVRFRGKGSYIAEQKLRRNINYMYNFTENMRDLGAVPSSVTLKSEVCKADEYVAQKLNLLEGQSDVFHITRLRCANGNPLLLETTYIPYYLCPGIEKINFDAASLYSVLLNQYALNLYHAEETIEAIIIEREIAELLRVSKKMPGYQIERVSYLNSGFICEYTKSYTRADRCVFKLDLYRNSGSGKNTVDFERRLSPV
jgi:GntR family transcriptional regulator